PTEECADIGGRGGAVAGDVDRAVAMMDAISFSEYAGGGLRRLAAAVAAHDADRAEALVDSIGNRSLQGEVLTSVAADRAVAGDTRRLADVVTRVEGLLREGAVHADVTDRSPATVVRTVASLITALITAGLTERAADLRGWAESSTHELLDRN